MGPPHPGHLEYAGVPVLEVVVRTGLIDYGERDPEIDGRDDFDFLVPAEKLLTRK
mgnify:CR=1 FL=1